ncbi:uncharacterized protein LOC127796395 [Diospyros lotus]|uniref:uncharacterized protein LOC127796395 n=1 Tax=Diospyros lotus TaxID=55363 RepID=UPI0022510D80|nr:uncharacterized protein LOC127796395 [Diospyros lotus]
MLQSADDLSHQQSALATVRQGDFVQKDAGREKQWCDYCKRPYHTRETCWKIHGKPANWKPKNKREGTRSAYMTATSGDSGPKSLEKGSKTDLNLTEEQIQTLYRLLNQGTNSIGSSNHQPTGSVALQGPSLGDDDWQY